MDNVNMIQKVALSHVVTSLRIVLATMTICCLLYTLVILAIGQVVAPHTANGSLIHDQQGKIVGSECIAQAFSRPEYFWPRPSAVDYDASATGGSNLSPTNPKIRKRAKTIIARLGVAGDLQVPADLLTASGSGIDPHITLSAAKYQAKRVASARGIPLDTVLSIVDQHTERTGWLPTPGPLVNVLLVNMALDKIGK